MKKNKKPMQTTTKPVKKEKKKTFQTAMMWFLAFVLIASMFLPALVGFIM